MGIVRFVAIIVVIGLLVHFVKRWRARRISSLRQRPLPGGKMARCAQCGVHLPEGEAIVYRGLTYCSHAHLKVHTE